MTTTTRVKPKRCRALATAVTGLVVGSVLMVIQLGQGAPLSRAVGGFAIILAFAVIVVVFQTRSETVSALAGRPVDERWRLIHTEALAGAANVGAVAALVGFGVTEAMGRDNWQFAVMAIVISLSYLAGLGWFRWRL